MFGPRWSKIVPALILIFAALYLTTRTQAKELKVVFTDKPIPGVPLKKGKTAPVDSETIVEVISEQSFKEASKVRDSNAFSNIGQAKAEPDSTISEGLTNPIESDILPVEEIDAWTNHWTVQRDGKTEVVDAISTPESVSVALPNLIADYTPSGWEAPIVASSVSGTNTSDIANLQGGAITYVDLAFVNRDADVVDTFYLFLLSGTDVIQGWFFGGALQNYYYTIEDLEVTFPSGTYTITNSIDVTDVITESDETDNEYSRQFTWGGTVKPNLIANYTPSGWDYPIVPSSTSGTNTVGPNLLEGATTYVDLAFVNRDADIFKIFYIYLYDDDTKINGWYWTGLKKNYYGSFEDYETTISAGSHILKTVVDVTGLIDESDEFDNEYSRSFTWSTPKPNLIADYTPSGWSGPIVASSVSGTNTDGPDLQGGATTYIDVAKVNRDADIPETTRFYTYVYEVDTGSLLGGWYTDGLPKDYYTIGEDLEAVFDPGTHSIKNVADATGVVDESDETDNEYSKSFTWGGVAQPNLIADYTPSGWDYPIVPSSVSGTNTVGPDLQVGETTYIDFAFINRDADIPTSTNVYLYLYDTTVDNLLGGWDWAGILKDYYGYIEDFSTTFSTGSHTLKSVVDPTGVVDESNENDNEYSQSFTWAGTETADISIYPTELDINESEPSQSTLSYNSTGSDQSKTGQLPDTKKAHVPGRLIVKFKAGSVLPRSGIGTTLKFGLGGVDKLNNRYGVYSINKLFKSNASPLLRNTYLIKYSTSDSIDDILKAYLADPNVEYAEPDYMVRLQAIPDDPGFEDQWYLEKIRAHEAWGVGVGNSNVLIGIIDTGVDWDHPDLADNIWSNSDEIADNGVDDDGNGYVDDVRGWDFVDGFDTELGVYPGEDGATADNNPMDFDGHGTHCSGIASAVTDNSEGIAGLGRGCAIMPLRVGGKHLDGNSWLYMSYAASAIEYAVSNGARVVSMSFGTSGETIKNAVITAYNNNVVVLHAAGNDNADSPGTADDIVESISVAATDISDNKASFSNYGSWIDISAPGVSIYSTDYNDTYSYKQGTSMATPLVAGLAGLILAQNSSLTSAEVTDIIKNSADNIDANNPSYVGQLGSGRINAFSALLMTGQQNSFVISNIGGDTLRVSSISSDKGWLTFSPAVPPIKELTAGQSSAIQCVVDWSQVPYPSEQATATINSNDSDEPSLTVTVSAYPLAGPEVTSISPSSGANDGIIAITNLAGSNFKSGAGAKLSKGGSVIAASDLTVVSSIQITCNFDLTDAAEGEWDVAVINPNGKNSGGSGEGLFTVTLPVNQAPAFFTLLYPVNDTLLAESQPTFQWEEAVDPDAGDITRYTLYYSLDSSFVYSAMVDSLTNTQHTMTDTLANNKRHYWKVRAYDEQGAAVWCQGAASFRAAYSNNPPGKPEIVSPANGTVLLPEGALVWSEPSDPDDNDKVHYKLQMSTESDFVSIALVQDSIRYQPLFRTLADSAGQNAISLTLSELSEFDSLRTNTNYYWRVQAVDSHGDSSGYSNGPNYYRFRSGALLPDSLALVSPAPGSTQPTIQPLFYWESVAFPTPSDTVNYCIWIAMDDLFSGVTPETTRVNRCQLAAILSDNTVYYWKINAWDRDGLFNLESETRLFRIKTADIAPAAPDTVVLITPTLGSSETTLKPYFYWEPITGPSPADKVKYQVWISPDSLFTDADSVTLVENDLVSPDSLEDNERYFWKVRAYNLNEQINLYSDVHYFYTNIKLEPPVDFELSRPFNHIAYDSTIVDSTVTFSWTSSSDPDYADTITYRFSLATDSLFSAASTIVDQINLTETSLPLDMSILEEADTTYYWRVVAVDTDSLPTWGSLSDLHPWTFTISWTSSIREDKFAVLPDQFILRQNYPNPFNPETTIRFALPVENHVVLDIYNISGQMVRRLVDASTAAGFHKIRWDGRDMYGRQVTSGIYFYSIQVVDIAGSGKNFRAIKKMVVLK